jgi:protein SCO1/2
MGRALPRILMVIVGTVFAASLAYLLTHLKQRPEVPGAGSGVVVSGGSGHSKVPLTPDAEAAGLSIPPFTLTTSDGGTITRDVLLGHITIVDFFFTRCIFVCPVLTQQMVDQLKALNGTSVRFLSVSVDPEHETNESLKAYFEEHVPKGTDPARWVFARGTKETIGEIITGGMKFAVGEDPNRTIDIEGGKKMKNILHPSWFVLVGPKAEVLGVYQATDESEMRALTERARAAAALVK